MVPQLARFEENTFRGSRYPQRGAFRLSARLACGPISLRIAAWGVKQTIIQIVPCAGVPSVLALYRSFEAMSSPRRFMPMSIFSGVTLPKLIRIQFFPLPVLPAKKASPAT